MDNSLSTKENIKLQLFDKIKGIIYGAALGDAVGLSTEFMTEQRARELYGVGPIKFGNAKGYEFWRDRHRSRWFPNDFTDDTDQMLLILQCLLSSHGYLIQTHFAYRLKEWTEKGFPELNKIACGIGYTVGSVLSHPEFLSNPHKAAYDIWNSNERNLAANGAVMRTSVLGVPYFWDEITVVENSIRAAKVTHADPRSVLSAVITSVVVSRILQDVLVEEKIKNLPQKFNADKQKEIVKVFDAGSPHSVYDVLATEGFQQYNVDLQPKPKAEPPQTTTKSFLKRFFSFNKSPADDLDVLRACLPNYEQPDDSRLKNAVKVPENHQPIIDSYGADTEMMSLCKNVVEQYEFLLSESALISSDGKASNSQESTWTEELHAHCFPLKLSDLGLSDPAKIGYTFKCLGSGIYCLTRAKPEKETSGSFFKSIITELTLQAGDADTNCAVAGALLGCRIGFAGLPKDWLEGLRHFEFLEAISNQLCNAVWSKYNEN